MVISELLHRLGYEGFMQLTKRLAQRYYQNRDVVLQAASKYLSGESLKSFHWYTSNERGNILHLLSTVLAGTETDYPHFRVNNRSK